MIFQIDKDIFLAPVDVIAHQANCFHTMGSGIARAIRENFPEAYEADCKTIKGDRNKMGTYSSAKVVTENPNPQLKYIANVYSQFDFGRDKRYTNYEAVANGLESLRNNLIKKGRDGFVVGLPWKYGCNIAGGDWDVVYAIVKSIFKESSINAIICKHPDANNLNQRIIATPSQPA
jgi:O-acetyl-ADP-ribose deacetylase (regulator of RNase III)